MDLIIITGQTATGKTDLALKYAKKYKGELVNFDSRQVYKRLDIITGKDILKIKNEKLKIWLYDVVNPDQYYSSFEYIKDAQNIIEDIKKRGKTPILVGGSYFYLKHLLYGFDYKVPPDFQLRNRLNKKTVKDLQNLLIKINKKTYEQMNNSDKNNPRRLIRKIEILKNVEKLKSLKAIKNKPFNLYTFKPLHKLFIGLRYKNKDELKKAIETRVEKRLKQGAIEEVKKLLKKGYKISDPGLKTIGYKQIIEFLEGRISEQKAIEHWVTAEVQYAKRQYTFMKKDKNIRWTQI